MRKITTKLALRKETLRSLADTDLGIAHGGAIPETRTNCDGGSACNPAPTAANCSVGIVCATTRTVVNCH
jgi:hypothetical protein